MDASATNSQVEGPSHSNLAPLPVHIQPHPLLMSTVVSHVFQYLKPSFLLQARLVCRTWNELATSRLTRAGWVVNLEGQDVALAYVVLFRRSAAKILAGIASGQLASNWADVERAAAVRTRMQICLPLSLKPNADGLRELRCALQLTNNQVAPPIITSLKLKFWNSSESLISGMEFFDPVTPPRATDPQTFESGLSRLLESVGRTLTELKITFHTNEERDGGRDRETIQAAFKGEGTQTHQPSYNLIALKTLHLITESRPGRLLLLPILQTLSQAAPNLAALVVSEQESRTVEDQPEPVPELQFMEEIQSGRLNLAAQLRSMDIDIGRVNLATRFIDTDFITRLHFPILRQLRIRIAQFGVFTTGSRLVQFVARSCPVLKSLQVDVVTNMRSFYITDFPPRQHENLEEDPPLKLNMLAELSCNLQLRNHGGSATSEAVFMLMRSCPNLTRLNIDMGALATILGLFNILGGRVPGQELVIEEAFIPTPFQMQWPGVKTLVCKLNRFEGSDHPPDVDLIDSTCFLIQKMLPNLDRVILSMATDEWESRQRELVYALAIAFGFGMTLDEPGPRHVEIDNLHEGLTSALSELAQEGSWSWPEHPDLDPRRRREGSTELHSLSLKGAPRSLLRSVDRFDESLKQGHLDLSAFISLVPRTCPNLVLRIDPELLLLPKIYPPTFDNPWDDEVEGFVFGNVIFTLNEARPSQENAQQQQKFRSRQTSSYQQLLEEFSMMNNPRVEFL